MLCADAMVGATEPVLQVAEDEVDDRQELFGHLGGAAFGDGVVIEAARPQAAIGAPIVGDDPRPRHDGAFDETTQRIGAAVGGDGQPHAPRVAAILPLVLRGAGLPLADFDGSGHQRLVVNASAFTARPASDITLVDLDIFSFSGTDPVAFGPDHASAELVQDAEGGLVPAQPELPLKLHRGHALRLTGDQVGSPEPCAQGCAAALHHGADRHSRLAAAGAHRSARPAAWRCGKVRPRRRIAGRRTRRPSETVPGRQRRSRHRERAAETREGTEGIAGRCGRERPWPAIIYTAHSPYILWVYVTTG